MNDFKEVVVLLKSALKKIRAADPVRYAYIKRHLIVDKKKETILFTGKKTVLMNCINALFYD